VVGLFLNTLSGDMIKHLIFFILFSFIFASCSQAPVASPPATLQVITISIAASLEPLKASLQNCAGAQPGIGLFINLPDDGSATDPNLKITLGEPATPAGFEAPLATEDLVVVINQTNKLTALSTDDLRALYTGQMTQWEKLGSPLGTVEVWDYAASDQLHRVFDQAVLKGSKVASQVYLAPTPAAIVEALSSNPEAIGYLPRAWLSSDKIHPVELEEDVTSAMRLPVLALASHEPVGALRTLVACLQTGRGHNEILQKYQPAKP
jgi:hypothetical protein